MRYNTENGEYVNINSVPAKCIFFTDLLASTNYVLEGISHPPLICCQAIDQNNTIKLNSLIFFLTFFVTFSNIKTFHFF